MDSRFIQTSYGRVHAQVTGAGLPVIFIHGRVAPLNSARAWAANAGVVAEAGFRTVVLELPGFGEAARPEGEIFTESAVDCVLELFERMAMSRAAFVGHHWGGLVAWRAALIEPRRIVKLGLVAAEGAEQLSSALAGELSPPTLVLWEKDDPSVPASHADLFVEAIPLARKHIFMAGREQPELAHQAPQLLGKEFNDQLIAFLRE
nr:alpha/beta fold hydrolase [Chloroflexota bacterium]